MARKTIKEREFQRRLGGLIRDQRTKAQLPAGSRIVKNESLAHALGVTHSCVSNWETGIRSPTAFNLARAAKAMGMQPHELGQMLLSAL